MDSIIKNYDQPKNVSIVEFNEEEIEKITIRLEYSHRIHSFCTCQCNQHKNELPFFFLCQHTHIRSHLSHLTCGKASKRSSALRGVIGEFTVAFELNIYSIIEWVTSSGMSEWVNRSLKYRTHFTMLTKYCIPYAIIVIVMIVWWKQRTQLHMSITWSWLQSVREGEKKTNKAATVITESSDRWLRMDRMKCKRQTNNKWESISLFSFLSSIIKADCMLRPADDTKFVFSDFVYRIFSAQFPSEMLFIVLFTLDIWVGSVIRMTCNVFGDDVLVVFGNIFFDSRSHILWMKETFCPWIVGGDDVQSSMFVCRFHSACAFLLFLFPFGFLSTILSVISLCDQRSFRTICRFLIRTGSIAVHYCHFPHWNLRRYQASTIRVIGKRPHEHMRPSFAIPRSLLPVDWSTWFPGFFFGLFPTLEIWKLQTPQVYYKEEIFFLCKIDCE